ncbi:28 kDa ribonucleoprotein, chloroplastic [Cornus florida]|uniref:28 kDa ribonucleoprotein, chloroplastic n=1 Tax=Cornus florida TaxID=4283 RepID=UPI0028A23648|nr:28 kDa ribonucleoprotein, chloroplastic [Cornus florida]XP_059631292.1 28 kDa ribonucleoprotein, chloroplastic [Cornus florida]
MALLRLLHFPSTTHFSTQQSFVPSTSPITLLQKPLHSNNTIFALLSLSLSNPSSLSLSHFPPIRTRRPRIVPFNFSSPTQTQATIETPELENSETVEEEENEFSRTRLLAQNVPWTCTTDDIRSLFEKYGTVVDIEISMYNKTRNRGLAFVSMSSPEEALAAFNNLESYEFEGRVLKLNWARPKKQPSPPSQPKAMPVHNLFVANLPFQARAKDLKEFFNTENANVVSAEIIFHDNPRRSAGYGFVSFNSKKEAEAALLAFQGKTFMERSIRVAPSKRFLRQGTKLNIQPEITSTESNTDAKQSEGVVEA